MIYGKQIGLKFLKDGFPLLYPGNTVIADITRENSAYAVICYLLEKLEQLDLTKLFIMLPDDSYHMTVIRGVNDQVRTSEFWPSDLSPKAAMSEADNYIKSCVDAVEVPDDIHMRFQHVQIDESDFRVCLSSSDDDDERKLRNFRNQVAERLGLLLPGHESYIFHITLAYTMFLPDEEKGQLLAAYKEEMDQFLQRQDSFLISKPRIAFYNNMMHFSHIPIERK